MAKKKNKTYLVLLVILIIVIVIGYQKYGPKMVDEEEEPAEEEEAEVEVEEEAAEPEEEAQPLYPDLCYAAGGTPRPTSEGCRSGEENIGDVPGFKVPNICCVKE